MEKTFNELDNDLRSILDKMANTLKTEWAEYQSSIVKEAWEEGKFSGDWETDQGILETLGMQVRIYAAEQMQRNNSGWSGGAGNSNNVLEGLRHTAASDVFTGAMHFGLFNAYRTIVGTR